MRVVLVKEPQVFAVYRRPLEVSVRPNCTYFYVVKVLTKFYPCFGGPSWQGCASLTKVGRGSGDRHN